MKIPAAWREGVYALEFGAVLLLAALVSFGIITLDQINGFVLAAVAILGILAPLLALLHITPDQPTPPTEE